MNCLGIGGKPLVLGIGAILTAGAEAPLESTTGEALKGSGVVCAPAGGDAPHNAGPRGGGEAKAALTRLQQMLREILDPLALQDRPVKEWRSLYKSFFAFFAPNGSADETERRAWTTATDVFNTNLIAANRRASFLGSVFDYDPRFSILEYRATRNEWINRGRPAPATGATPPPGSEPHRLFLSRPPKAAWKPAALPWDY
ncbi:MAG: hypothetical protein ACLQM8_05515 [Limisphaerales bacterium]